MRRAALPLVVLALSAAPCAWALDVLEPVTVDTVLASVKICADAKPEDVKEFACYKPGGALGPDTFVQVAVDLQFREIDKRALAYLEALRDGITAQPVDFSHSILTCFDPTSAGPFVPACSDNPASGPRNFPALYRAACDGSAGLAAAAMSKWNAANKTSLAFPSDGEITAVLIGEKREDGKPSCRRLADKKLAIYKRVANLLARQALQSGYDQARQEFVSRISAQYTSLLQKMQRLGSKLDLINDKWKGRTKNPYK